jgi:hypothetical protein
MRETRQPANRGAIEQHDTTFWRHLYRNGAEWGVTGVACLENPPLATGTYPAWYTAALRTSAASPGDGLPEDGTPESEIWQATFRFHTDMSAQAVRRKMALLNAQGGTHDRGRDEVGGPSH